MLLLRIHLIPARGRKPWLGWFPAVARLTLRIHLIPAREGKTDKKRLRYGYVAITQEEKTITLELRGVSNATQRQTDGINLDVQSLGWRLPEPIGLLVAHAMEST